MALVPKDLLEQIQDLERLFIVPKEKLITISDHFVKELDKGEIMSKQRLILWAYQRREGVLY
jgi:hexokinase